MSLDGMKYPEPPLDMEALAKLMGEGAEMNIEAGKAVAEGYIRQYNEMLSHAECLEDILAIIIADLAAQRAIADAICATLYTIAKIVDENE